MVIFAALSAFRTTLFQNSPWPLQKDDQHSPRPSPTIKNDLKPARDQKELRRGFSDMAPTALSSLNKPTRGSPRPEVVHAAEAPVVVWTVPGNDPDEDCVIMLGLALKLRDEHCAAIAQQQAGPLGSSHAASSPATASSEALDSSHRGST